MIPHWGAQKDQFYSQIKRHIDKSDFTIIDLTGFPKQIQEEVAGHLLSLPQAMFDKVIPIGF